MTADTFLRRRVVDALLADSTSLAEHRSPDLAREDEAVLLSTGTREAFSVHIAASHFGSRSSDDLASALLSAELLEALRRLGLQGLHVTVAFHDDTAALVPPERVARAWIVERLVGVIRRGRPGDTPIVYDASTLGKVRVACVSAVIVSSRAGLTVTRVGTPRDRVLARLQQSIDDRAYSLDVDVARISTALRRALPEFRLVAPWLLIAHAGGAADVSDDMRIWPRGFGRVSFLDLRTRRGLVELHDRGAAKVE